jgi:hypothetical protein
VAKRKKSFSCNNISASFAKVENVVNPPQIPTARKILHCAETRSPLSTNPKISPITILPTTFTTRVPHGNSPATFTCTYLATKNRSTLPTNPPIPTIKIVLIISPNLKSNG